MFLCALKVSKIAVICAFVSTSLVNYSTSWLKWLSVMRYFNLISSLLNSSHSCWSILFDIELKRSTEEFFMIF